MWASVLQWVIGDSRCFPEGRRNTPGIVGLGEESRFH